MRFVVTKGNVRVYLGNTISHDIKDSLIAEAAKLIATQILSGGKIYNKEGIVINYQVEAEIPDGT